MTPFTIPWLATLPSALATVAIALVTLIVIIVVLRSARKLQQKIAVIVLNALLAVALLAFLFPPLHSASSGTVTLITAGATDAQRSSARRSANTFAMGDVSLSERERDDIRTVPDLTALQRRVGGVTTLAVVGAGLDASAWRESPGWSINFSPPPPRAGVRHATWQRRLNAGEPLVVSGTLVATGDDPLRVSLRDPAGEISATALSEPGLPFELRGSTRAPGRFLYRLWVENADGTLVENLPVPVEVITPNATRILMLLSSPSFESRAVKEWARRGGAQLAVRTTISRDRNQLQFINRDPLPLKRIDGSTLAQFDLLIADVRAWSALEESEKGAIEGRVRDDGLGVLLTVTEPFDDALPFPALLPSNTRPAALDIDGLDAAALTVTLAPAMFAGSPRTLAKDVANETVAAAAPYGNGKLGITLVTDSHALVTAGQVQLHARYWQALVAGLVRSRVEPGIEFAPLFPRPGQRVQVCVYGDELPATADMHDAASPVAIALRPHPWRPGERCGYLWPQREGWQALQVGSTGASVYVFGNDAWRARRAARRTADTRLAASNSTDPGDIHALPARALPRWWFASLLLIFAASLWLEAKWYESVGAGARS